MTIDPHQTRREPRNAPEDDREDLPIPDAWNQLTRRIIGCAMEVHSTLGPGLLEKLHEHALANEFAHAGLHVQRQ